MKGVWDRVGVDKDIMGPERERDQQHIFTLQNQLRDPLVSWLILM